MSLTRTGGWYKGGARVTIGAEGSEAISSQPVSQQPVSQHFWELGKRIEFICGSYLEGFGS